MADFSQAEKINIFLKMIFGIQGLSNTEDALGLKWYNEKYSWQPFVLNQELYVENVPTAINSTVADTNVTNNPTMIEKRDIKMSLVNGTNGRAWMAFQTYNDDGSGIYGDWLIPQIFGQGYAARLFQDNGSGTGVGTEITTTEGAWIPTYKLGSIVLASGYTATDQTWTTPLWVRVYRYIGNKGISGSTYGGDLDDAYNNGDTITVDDGAVTLTASGGYAPLQLTPVSSAPNTSLAAGQLCINGSVLYAYDSTRTKWLSVDQPAASFQTRSGDGNYLSTGVVSDTNSGLTALRNGTLIGIAAIGGTGNQTKAFAVRKNGVVTDLTTFSLTAGKYYSASTDINFSAGDVLQVYCSDTGAPITSPRVSLHIAWRIS